jgi:nucleotide-binding universal stress UspA family protein
MYRKILVPVDEPTEVEPLIRFGAALLDADGEVRVLHVIGSGSLPAVTRAWRQSVNLVVPAHEAGAALDVRVDPEVRAANDVAGEILESAETHGVDAILMTLRGSRRSHNPFVGHTSSSVLHHAHADVLIVNRLALLEERIPRILIPTIGGPPPPKALQVAEELAMRHKGSPVITLAIGTKERPSDTGPAGPTRSPRGVPIERRDSFFSKALLGRRRLPELILQQASRERYGLLLVADALSPMEGPLLTRRFLEELFRRAPCPVMAIRG